MIKKKYEIVLDGCDDSTKFKMELTNEEFELLEKVSAKSNEASKYCCMPRMYLYEVTEEESKK